MTPIVDEVLRDAYELAADNAAGCDEIVAMASLPTFVLALFVKAIADGDVDDPIASAREIDDWLLEHARNVGSDPHLSAIESMARAYSPTANTAPIAEVK